MGRFRQTFIPLTLGMMLVVVHAVAETTGDASVKRARTALTSGGLEPVLDKGGGDHSVFAKAFLEALGENGDVLEGQELFERVRGRVALNAPQTPQYADIKEAGHEHGEFLFIPLNLEIKGTVAIPHDALSPAPPAFDERQLELKFWDSIEDSDDPGDFEDYIAQNPNGTFVRTAKRRIGKLKEEKQVAVVVPPKIAVAPMDTELVAVKTVNLRSGPSTDYEKAGRLSAGEHVTVTGKVKDAEWYRVEREGRKVAFVFGPLLKEPSVAPTPVQPAVGVYPEAKKEARRYVQGLPRVPGDGGDPGGQLHDGVAVKQNEPGGCSGDVRELGAASSRGTNSPGVCLGQVRSDARGVCGFCPRHGPQDHRRLSDL